MVNGVFDILNSQNVLFTGFTFCNGVQGKITMIISIKLLTILKYTRKYVLLKLLLPVEKVSPITSLSQKKKKTIPICI